VIGIYQKDCSVREGASIGEEGGELAWVGIFFIFCFSLIQECINIDMLPLIKLRMLVGKTLYKRVGHGSGHRNPMFHTGQGIRCGVEASDETGASGGHSSIWSLGPPESKLHELGP